MRLMWIILTITDGEKMSIYKRKPTHPGEILLKEFLESDSPGKTVSEKLDEIDSLLPAIIELNIKNYIDHQFLLNGIQVLRLHHQKILA